MKQTTQRIQKYKSKEWGFYDAINNTIQKKDTIGNSAIRAKNLATKRKRMQRADTVFRFDPRVHMDLSSQELAKLESYEKLRNL